MSRDRKVGTLPTLPDIAKTPSGTASVDRIDERVGGAKSRQPKNPPIRNPEPEGGSDPLSAQRLYDHVSRSSLRHRSTRLAEELQSWDVYSEERDFVDHHSVYEFLNVHRSEFVDLIGGGPIQLDDRAAFLVLLYRAGRRATPQQRGYRLSLPLRPWLNVSALAKLAAMDSEIRALVPAQIAVRRALGSPLWPALVDEANKLRSPLPDAFDASDPPDHDASLVELLARWRDASMLWINHPYDGPVTTDPANASAVSHLLRRARLGKRWRFAMEGFVQYNDHMGFVDAYTNVPQLRIGSQFATGSTAWIGIGNLGFYQPDISSHTDGHGRVRVSLDALIRELHGAYVLLTGHAEPGWDARNHGQIKMLRGLRAYMLRAQEVGEENVWSALHKLRQREILRRICDTLDGELRGAVAAGMLRDDQRPLLEPKMESGALQKELRRWDQALPMHLDG